jgi:catechol 2,3-dioxygenase-like lactoylglutathione lyase family enzyme
MIRPERIGHVVIKVRNLERSRKFYTEVLGMDVMMEVPAIHGGVPGQPSPRSSRNSAV